MGLGALSRIRTRNNGSEDHCDIHFTMSADFLALSAGVEPTLLVPETSVLSIELREPTPVIILFFKSFFNVWTLDIAEDNLADLFNDRFNF